MQVAEPCLQHEACVHESIDLERRKRIESKSRLVDRNCDLAEMPFKLCEGTKIGCACSAEIRRKKAGKLLTVFRNARGGGRMSPDKFLRGLVQKQHPEKPGGGRELGPDRGDEARSIVPLMNRKAPSGITPTNEVGWNAGGITVDDGAADPQLRLSQRRHGGAPGLASGLRPRPRAWPRPARRQTAEYRYPIRST